MLFKPQFECEGKNLTKHGILPVAHHKKLLATFYDFAISLGLPTVDIVNAPIRERKNVEYICINNKEIHVPEEIKDRAICIQADIGEVLRYF